MKDVERILAAIGFSKYSRGILEYAARLATCLDSSLLIANVINVRDMQAVSGIQSMGYEVDPQEYKEGVIKERSIELEKLMEGIQFDRERLKTIFRVGHPLDILLKIVEEEKIDMVVMRPKGRTDLQHVLVGSVAEKMFRYCPVPLVSYRMR
ncbi:MAG TPA: universal stress protein [Desulfobacteraceae bacterium]|nr:universal stress protein [Desulfobacteraceae bacterium]